MLDNRDRNTEYREKFPQNLRDSPTNREEDTSGVLTYPKISRYVKNHTGGYVHVKGKKRAPPPPSRINLENTSASHSIFTTKNVKDSPLMSTINRKKRKAPAPPLVISSSSRNTNDLKFNFMNSIFNNEKVKILPLNMTRIENQKQTEVVERTINGLDEFPISSKLLHKRPTSIHGDNFISTTHETILKDRQGGAKTKISVQENNSSKPSLFGAGYKIGFFRGNRNHHHSKIKEEEKGSYGGKAQSVDNVNQEASTILNGEQTDTKSQQKCDSLKDIYLLYETSRLFSNNKEEKDESFTNNIDKIDEKRPDESSKMNLNPEVKEESLYVKSFWNCPDCTVENPNWRITCKVCERPTPLNGFEVFFGGKSNKKDNLESLQVEEIPTKANDLGNTKEENKTEKTSKYFDSRPNNKPFSNSLLGPTIGRKEFLHKTPSPYRLSVDSSGLSFKTFFGLPESETQNSKTDDLKGNISSQTPQIIDNDHLTHPIYLEVEKQRLRQKIREMNAKALTEKYPVLPVPPKLVPFDFSQDLSTNQDTKSKLPNDNNHQDQGRHGAIKKTPPENRTNSSTETEPIYSKPKKVSASVQTSSVPKKSPEIEKLDSNRSNEKFLKIGSFLKNKNQKENSPKSSNNVKEDIQKNDESKPKNTELNYLTLNRTMKELEAAIAKGEDKLAAEMAMHLAKMKVLLQVTKSDDKQNQLKNDDPKKQQDFIINIPLPPPRGNTQLTIDPQMTILQLKQMIFNRFNIAIEAQKWMINDEFANNDYKTLQQYSTQNNSSKFHLNLDPNTSKKDNKGLLSKSIAVTPPPKETNDPRKDKNSKLNNETETTGATELKVENTKTVELKKTLFKDWECHLCTLINPFENLVCSACSNLRPLCNYSEENGIIPKELSKNKIRKTNVPLIVSWEQVKNKYDQNKSNNTRVKDGIGAHFITPNAIRVNYRGVDIFNPNSTHFNPQITFLNEIQIQANNNQAGQSSSATTSQSSLKNHYDELLDLENSHIVLNVDPFECPVCFDQVQSSEGVVLRDCLHNFCKECLINTVKFSEEATVKCPFMDTEYSCTSILQEREIKAIVAKDVYELHLAKSVRLAEHHIENAFHCKTPNCRGWCIYEDNVNQFKCPVCKLTNCLTCRVIHEGLTCKQYQDVLNSDHGNNEEANKTKEMLKEMVENGEAMNCPTCQIILMKKWGCDWLKCSMCKTEICWVTRGPRWGPEGKGDTSEGCKCGVDGKKCHPKCNYCH